MPLRLLAIDFPPLLRDLLARTLHSRNESSGSADEAVFVELPATGGDVGALAAAARADVVLTPLDAGQWPEYCARMVGRRVGVAVFGVGFSDGQGRIDEVRAIEMQRNDVDIAHVELCELIDRAANLGAR